STGGRKPRHTKTPCGVLPYDVATARISIVLVSFRSYSRPAVPKDCSQEGDEGSPGWARILGEHPQDPVSCLHRSIDASRGNGSLLPPRIPTHLSGWLGFDPHGHKYRQLHRPVRFRRRPQRVALHERAAGKLA